VENPWKVECGLEDGSEGSTEKETNGPEEGNGREEKGINNIWSRFYESG